ncbi:hypothetical protein BABINDRAFT_163404 [Babjeviella inositovora NRRL Y-12698]|uniref:RGS domain-containing protein n=1 Tax=Babjeviella inositovora NRRL Y-12698 TaxID=984486 RepID=A0A1E3QJQ5_9ASCO|nr:uncharacterized protein BABINDRAFT_163404 [Babjeviella inositovora NRRL Y-12698]ODQ77694.1 hypothetical protein BABINDRAFT_163404 [Babjeviella inositovora NRRL Y-12698]
MSPALPSPLQNARHATPTLDDVLQQQFESTFVPPPYNMATFAEFLARTHQLENLEFVLETIKYVNVTETGVKVDAWMHLYRNFLAEDSVKEVNLPHAVKDKLLRYNGHIQSAEYGLCDDAVIVDAHKIVKVLLADAYVEFAQTVRRSQLILGVRPVAGDYQFGQATKPRRASEYESPLQEAPHRAITLPLSPAHPTSNPLSVQIDEEAVIDEEDYFKQPSRNGSNSSGRTLVSEAESRDSRQSSVERDVRKSNTRKNSNDMLWGMKKVGRKLIYSKWRRTSSTSSASGVDLKTPPPN